MGDDSEQGKKLIRELALKAFPQVFTQPIDLDPTPQTFTVQSGYVGQDLNEANRNACQDALAEAFQLGVEHVKAALLEIAGGPMSK